MSVRQRSVLKWSSLSGLLIVLSVVSARAVLGGATGDTGLTIVVTAKDMMYNGTNPEIVLAPGQRVRLVLRNEEPGVKHDLVIPELNLRTPLLEFGEQAVLEFLAPDRGTFVYLCSLHPVRMRGVVRVRNPNEPGAEGL